MYSTHGWIGKQSLERKNALNSSSNYRHKFNLILKSPDPIARVMWQNTYKLNVVFFFFSSFFNRQNFFFHIVAGIQSVTIHNIEIGYQNEILTSFFLLWCVCVCVLKWTSEAWRRMKRGRSMVEENYFGLVVWPLRVFTLRCAHSVESSMNSAILIASHFVWKKNRCDGYLCGSECLKWPSTDKFVFAARTHTHTPHMPFR